MADPSKRPFAIGLILAMTLSLGRAGPSRAASALPEAEPEAVGLDPARLAEVGEAVRRAVEKGTVPGAVVLVGRRGKIAYAGVFGRRAVEPEAEAMTRDTIFDLASLTKPVATATAVMILVERGKVGLGDPITKHLPEFDNHGKREITVEHLLRHRSGLIADNSIRDYADGPARAWERISELGLIAKPSERFLYSDVNFLVLGRLVERLSGQTLDVFVTENVITPLGLADTGYRPAAIGRVAPTERDENGTMLRGVVHDPRARALGGVAGHAGLFGTADDLAVFAQMVLDEGKMPGGHVLFPATIRAMIAPGDTPPRQRRGLGWDIATSFSGSRGKGFGSRSFGHTGFTGTSLWIDPDAEMFVILLTSRLHPDGKGQSPTALRAEVATLAASAIVNGGKDEAPPAGPVSCGIDVLASGGFRAIRDRRVGLVTNHTGLTWEGRSTIDVLFQSHECKLVALFSPEHGIRGIVDAEVADDRDERTGLPIYSLYGKTRKPTPESLDGVDVLVYDIQDIGARFYTYISTLGLLLEATKEKGIPVVVLDRPNPIGGVEVAGPVREAEFESFIAHHALPVRHGMTVGELARLFNAERKIGADLTVIPCRGWRRSDLFDATGLLWVNPSPNMRSLTEALLYPGVGLLEATNLATGRGTDTPFERVGAPWIDPRQFAALLNGHVPGARFVPIRFTPKERQYAGQECGGVYITITDRATFEPLALGIHMAVVLRTAYRDHWKPDGLLKFIADRPTYEAILEGRRFQEIVPLWNAKLAEFRAIRERYLLYR